MGEQVRWSRRSKREGRRRRVVQRRQVSVHRISILSYLSVCTANALALEILRSTLGPILVHAVILDIARLTRNHRLLLAELIRRR